MKHYITTTQLAAMFGISRAEMANRLMQAGLCCDAQRPTEKAVAQGICRVQPTWGENVIVLWHAEKTKAGLDEATSPQVKAQARQAFGNAVATARQVMQWGDIVEMVIAMKVEDQGYQARVI
jgi:hypothetical protein